MIRHLPIVGILVILVALMTSCRGKPTDTVSKCYPPGADCSRIGVKISPETDQVADLKLGKSLFSQRCETCHSRDGSGMGQPSVGDFRKPIWHAKWSHDKIVQIVTSGRGKMPGQTLGPHEFKSLTAYLRTLKITQSPKY